MVAASLRRPSRVFLTNRIAIPASEDICEWFAVGDERGDCRYATAWPYQLLSASQLSTSASLFLPTQDVASPRRTSESGLSLAYELDLALFSDEAGP